MGGTTETSDGGKFKPLDVVKRGLDVASEIGSSALRAPSDILFGNKEFNKRQAEIKKKLNKIKGEP